MVGEINKKIEFLSIILTFIYHKTLAYTRISGVTRVKIIYLWQIVKLARLPIVLAVIPIFLIGVLFALRTGAEFSIGNFLWGFSILFLIEIAASFANDYFDYEADKHNRQFGFSGGSGVLLEYPKLLPFAKWASVFMFLFSLLLTVVFVLLSSFPLWAIAYIGVAVFFCWFYTAPPLRLVYRGLGELPHLLAGIMFPGWGYFILTGTISYDLLVFAIPFGFLGLTVILNFEIPDMEADLHGGKRNLIVNIGRRSSFITIFCLYFITLVYFLILTEMQLFNNVVNLWLISLLVCIPLVASLLPVMKKSFEREAATKFAIRNAVAGFLSSFLIMITLVF
ncbi:MAG: prenyltransferase [Candidatus Thermoplasmatota archaeon]|nr:prenyltransferase [Candidatus Thermoplasmatota archaeon]